MNDVARQIARLDDRALGLQHDPFDDVLQFTNISGPPIGDQHIHRRGRKLKRRHAMNLAVRLQVMLNQQRDVADALAQRRNAQSNNVQPEIQVFAEKPRFDLRLQIAVGRGNESHVHASVSAVRADALNFAGLKKAEQHDLHARAHLADFVEEHGAVGCHLEQARLVAIRAGEAAAHVSEQLRLDQGIRQSGAVQRHERPGRPAAALMDQTSDNFFADACFASYQDLRVGARGAIDIRLDRSNGFAMTDEADFLLSFQSRQRRSPYR